MTDHITQDKEHQAVRGYLNVLTKAGTKSGGSVGQVFVSKALLGSVSGAATHGETYMERQKMISGTYQCVGLCVMQTALEPYPVRMMSLKDTHEGCSWGRRWKIQSWDVRMIHRTGRREQT